MTEHRVYVCGLSDRNLKEPTISYSQFSCRLGGFSTLWETNGLVPKSFANEIGSKMVPRGIWYKI